MDDGEPEREIAAMQREEELREQEEERRASIIAALRTGLLHQTFAGCWGADEEHLVIAVTADPEGAGCRVREISPEARFSVVTADHSFTELEALADAVQDKADRIHAPLVATGIDEEGNRVTVTLERLEAPASLVLREHFAAEPVDWEEGTVEAA